MTQIYEILPETFSARVILMANGRMYTVHIGENIMLELAGKQITERILLTLPMLSSLTLDETTNQMRCMASVSQNRRSLRVCLK